MTRNAMNIFLKEGFLDGSRCFVWCLRIRARMKYIFDVPSKNRKELKTEDLPKIKRYS